MFAKLISDYKDSIKPGKNIYQETNSYFKENYFNNPNPDLKFKPPFTPGEIYYFSYQTDSKISKQRPFIDRFPILFCTETFNTIKAGTIIKGIDLVVVPPKQRIDILERINDNFSDRLKITSESYEKGSAKAPLNLPDLELSVLLEGTGFKSALFGFKYRFIRRPGVVSLTDWSKLPFLTAHLLEGLKLEGIYKEYQTKLNF